MTLGIHRHSHLRRSGQEICGLANFELVDRLAAVDLQLLRHWRLLRCWHFSPGLRSFPKNWMHVLDNFVVCFDDAKKNLMDGSS